MAKTKAKAESDLPRRFGLWLQTHPSFRFALDNGNWLCPYCGAPAAGSLKASNFPSLALRHVLTKCPKANALQGQPMQERQLEEIVHFFRLKARYASVPEWRVRVGGGAWLCPFCVQPTEVHLVDGNGAQRPVDDVVRDIRTHLGHCYSYWQSPDEWRSVEEIRATLQERKQQDVRVQTVTECVESDPVFQFSDKRGRWICPFCEKPVESVDFSTPFARTHSAPRQVLAHLESGTCTYQGGQLDPQKTVAQMQEVVEGLAGEKPASAPPTPATDVEATQYFQTLRSELGELRSHLEHSKELQQDLERARKAQQRMLPSTPSDIPGYDLGAYFLPCEQVSGDFYDFTPLEDGRVGVLVGDVSGHGIDAGIVMGMAKKAFSLRAQSGEDPASIAAKVNNDIFPELERATFVTAVYGILDPREHTFRFVRCGHTFPIHCRADAGDVQEVRSEGLVLGSIDNSMFLGKTKTAEIRMEPGDAVVLFTDGLIEAMTEDEEEFGVERTKEAVLRHVTAAARGVIEGLIGSIHIFTAGHRQNDDQTMLVIRRLPSD